MGKEYLRDWPFEVCVFLSVQGTSIAILNVLSIIVFWRRRATLKRARYLLVNLAVADALVGVVEAVSSVLCSYYRVTEALVALFGAASLFSLSLISLERFLATWKPLRHRASPTRYNYLAIGLLWIFSTTSCILFLLDTNKLGLVKNVILPCISTVFIAAILCTILFSYTAIWYVVVFHPRPVHPNREQNKKLIKTLFIVTVLSLLAWTPSLVNFAVGDRVGSWRMVLTISVLMYGNSLVNPVVYIFRMQEFREELKRMFCRSCLSNQG